MVGDGRFQQVFERRTVFPAVSEGFPKAHILTLSLRQGAQFDALVTMGPWGKNWLESHWRATQPEVWHFELDLNNNEPLKPAGAGWKHYTHMMCQGNRLVTSLYIWRTIYYHIQTSHRSTKEIAVTWTVAPRPSLSSEIESFPVSWKYMRTLQCSGIGQSFLLAMDSDLLCCYYLSCTNQVDSPRASFCTLITLSLIFSYSASDIFWWRNIVGPCHVMFGPLHFVFKEFVQGVGEPQTIFKLLFPN